MEWMPPAAGVECAKMEVLLTPQQGTPMSEITVIGLDLAKHVFQVHGADHDGRPVLRKRLRRGQVLEFFASLSPCLIGMEACAGSHYWGRELQALGHEVRLIPPQYVKPYVKTNKNDAIDAEAISEALTRPTMRFTAVKSAEQQSVLMLHRTRELLVRQRTMLVNALRGHCGEFGIVAAQGLSRAGDLIKRIEDPADTALPDLARQALQCLTSQIRAIQEQIALIEKKLLAWHSSCGASRRLAEIPGVGLITATAVVASRRQCHSVPLGAPVRRLAWSGTAAALERRQGAARAYFQARRRLHQAPAGAWCARPSQLVETQEADPLGLAHRPARPPADQRRAARDGQQDRAHRLGHAEPGRKISGNDCRCCLSRQQPPT